MLNKVNIQYQAHTKTAQAEVNSLSKRQQELSGTINEVKGRGKELNATMSNVRAFEVYQSRIANINTTLKTNEARIEELTNKQSVLSHLTDGQREIYEKSTLAISRLNEVQAEKGALTSQESDSLKRHQKVLDSINKRYEKKTKLGRMEAKELERLKGKNKTLTMEEKSLANSLGDVSSKLQKAGIDTNSLGDAKDSLARKSANLSRKLKDEQAHLKRVSEHQERRNKALDKAKDTGKVAGAAALVAAGASYKVASDKEYQFAEVAKTLEDGTTEQEEKVIRRQLEVVAMDTANMNTEDAFALAAGGSAGGIKNAELVDYVKQTGKIASAWDMGAAETAEITMSIRNGMSLDSSGVNQLANEINVASNKFGTTAERVVKTVARDGASMTNNGFTNQQTVALATALNTIGLQSEQAGTVMKNMVLNMTAGDKASTASKDAFNEIGLDASDISEMMATDAQGALNLVFEGVRGLEKDKQAGVIKNIFGSEGFTQVQSLIEKKGWLQEIEAVTLNQTLVKGAVEAEYQKIAKTTAKKDEMLVDSLSDMSSAIGEALIPVADTVRPVLIGATQGVATFVRENKNLVAGLAVVGGGVAATATLMKAHKAYKGVKSLVSIGKEAADLKKVDLARAGASRSASGLARRIAVLDRAMRMAGRKGGGSGGGFVPDVDTKKKPTSRKPQSVKSKPFKAPKSKLGKLFNAGRSVAAYAGLTALDSVSEQPSMMAQTMGNTTRKVKHGISQTKTAQAVNTATSSMKNSAIASKSSSAMKSITSVVKNSSKIAKVASVAKKVPLLNVGLGALEMAGAAANGDKKGVAEAGGGTAGAAVGASVGAALFSIVPVVGTAFGAIVGGYLGDMAGRYLGGKAYDSLSGSETEQKLKAVEGKPLTNKNRAIEESQANQAASASLPPVQITVDARGATKEDAEHIAQVSKEAMKQAAREVVQEERKLRDRRNSRREVYSLGG